VKYLPQFLYILLFSFAGELLQALIPLPIPAAIYGLVLLLLALSTGLLKEEKVADASSFLISVMPVLFVAPVAKILVYWDLIAPNVAAIFVIVAVSTVFVFVVSGLVTKWLQGKKEDDTHG
jgi:holin-like protein